MWVQLVIAIVMQIVSYLLTPKQKPQSAKAGKLEVPIAEEGVPIGVLFGTCIIKAPLIVATGDARAIPIKKKGGKK